ncbi:MAG: bifunctional acetate--CoA ligase family protein/GNAT family N-acetyltransferase [Desulfobacteraceae bacterium]|jgi:acetyltransferase|nr:bifunctional acetate--CoA ligase family protein/GNAT family N-acetyltransferase [Desulfobacteraceae bacterium]
MSVYNLNRIFQPKSIAVIGASEKPGSVGASVMQNLISGGFTGDIYPVHPRYRKVYRRKVYQSVHKIDATIDMAVIATPINTVPEIVKECAAISCGGAVIISSGGRETGPEGAAIEEKIWQAKGQTDLRIIGPNCLGIVCSKSNLNASFAGRMPKPGKMAFVSQSGAICTSILDFAAQANMGFSYFVSLGSMLDTDFGDIIDFIGNDPEVSSIVMYIESLTRFRNFMSAARAVSRVKPIIAFKAGRSKAGAIAAASHTGAMAGEDAIYDAAFKRAGIVRVKTFEELFDCAEFIAKQPKPIGNGLAIVTNSGGPGVMAADCLSDYGVEPVALKPETITRLDKILPHFWSRSNPVDILGDASAERYKKAVEVLLDDHSINGLLIMFSPQSISDPSAVAEKLSEILVNRKIPVITAWMGGKDVDKGRKIFNQAGISTFDTPERAVRAFMDLYKYSTNNQMLQEIPPSLPYKLDFDRIKAESLVQKGLGRVSGLLTESEAKQLLSAYGIPVNPAETALDENAAVALADQIGYPVVLKIHSEDITHKTDVGGIMLNIRNEDGVREAFAQITANARKNRPDARIEGVSVQKMLPRSDYELIAGAKKDRDFGPVLLFGMGGIYTEVIKDRSIALPPINRLLARRLIEETKISRVLKGYRNLPGVDLMLLEEILIRLSQLITDFSEIEEIDINPLIAGENGIIAADARVVVKPSVIKAPLHLVISPYPNQYESLIELDGEQPLLIRPIRPEDAPLLEKLFESLSSQSVYFRFFSSMKRIPSHMLARFTQIDYDREAALVAISSSGDTDTMLGVARIIPEYDGRNAEFSIIVSDRWHGKGIGAQLLKRCLAMAWLRKIDRVWGQVMTDNVNMLALGRKLGFAIKFVPGSNYYELSLTFNRNDKDEVKKFDLMTLALSNFGVIN